MKKDSYLVPKSESVNIDSILLLIDVSTGSAAAITVDNTSDGDASQAQGRVYSIWDDEEGGEEIIETR